MSLQDKRISETLSVLLMFAYHRNQGVGRRIKMMSDLIADKREVR